MKKMMLGNEAVARGFYEAGCKVVSSYPGTPSTEITEYAAKYDEVYCEWAPNEKVGLEVAFGASLGGARAAACMKHVGLNVAADPLFTMSYTGVNGGLVVCVADDPGMHSSQNEQDSRHYAAAAKLPMLEPSDSREAKEFAKVAFELSEKFDTPVIFRTCTRIAHSQCAVELEAPIEVALKPYEKQPQKYIMAPANAIRRHPVVEARTAALTEYAEDCPLNRVEYAERGALGIITSGTCYQYVKEVFGDSVSVLKLGLVNPLPKKLILDFAAKVDRLVVVEELDPFIENHCRCLGLNPDGKNIFPICGEFSQALIAKTLLAPSADFIPADPVPVRPPVMCAGCPHRGLFYVLSKKKVTVIGDIGCYTLGSAAPLTAIDSVLCMGASVSGVHGFNKASGGASENKTVAVIGDSTFMHSGMTGLANIAYNGTNSTVIIVDNSITGMTGHQQNPTTGYNIKGDPATKIDLEALCHALGINRVRVVDPYDLAATEAAITEELAADEPSVIISRRPCALLKYVKAKPAFTVDSEKCKSCKMCMKIGCPAISMKDGKAKIDATLCVGCGVCQQMCKFDSILGGEE
ncbi:MAG: indolepyruvate ferredoxin oxidoreductase subunit alpha [Ruminococcaceae bacterium]|nr:indolepyruvate ferredoxin oxidoreductase subunit alpha [Oscillospiraceae bacterium]